MKPRVCIVTTPNRDFNALFDYLEALDPAVEKFEGFRRPEVPYRMRHHDHRFEWTRREFRLWAREAAEKFGYDVEFTGAGGLGRGMMVEGENVDAVLREAAETCGSVDEIPSGSSEWGEMKGIICPVDDNGAGQHPVLRAFGDCSQVAVFVIKAGGEEEVQPRHAEGETLRLVHIHNYSFQKEEFPPSLRAVLEPLMIGGRLLRFVPELIIEEWLKGDEHLKDARYRKQHGWPEDGQNWRELDDVSLQLSAKLGGKLWAINTVEVAIDAQRLWEETYALQRACHYRYEVFLDVLNGIKATEGAFDPSLSLFALTDI